jgi:hypothetical protein
VSGIILHVVLASLISHLGKSISKSASDKTL